MRVKIFRVNCYVLTGGLSRRMGRPKASLELAGVRFLDRIVEAAAPVFDEVVVVTRPGETSGYSGRTLVDTPHEGTSPMYGILAAMADSGADRVWIAAVDLPLVSRPLFQFLTGRFSDSDAELLVPRWTGHLQMLCAGYQTSLADDVRRRIDSGHFALHRIAEDRRAEIVEESEIRAVAGGDVLFNVNTPEELESLERKAGT